MVIKKRAGLAALIGIGSAILGMGGCYNLEGQLARREITRAQYEAKKEEQNNAMAGLTGGIIAGVGAQRGQPGAVAVGQVLSARSVAKAGRSETQQTVNVNVHTDGTSAVRPYGIDDYLREHGGMYLSNVIDGNDDGDINDEPVDKAIGGDSSIFYNNSMMVVSALTRKYAGKSIEMTLRNDFGEELFTQSLVVGRETDGNFSVVFKYPIPFNGLRRILKEEGSAERVLGIRQYTVEVRAVDGSLPADVRRITVDFEHPYKE